MIELRPYQREAIDAFRSFVAEPEQSRGMIVLPTGTGKTVLGLSLAKEIGGRTLWIAHRNELITQPMRALKTVWPGVRGGVVKAERNEWARDFVFASVQTAWREERRKKLTGFDLVVVDECHHSAAESYKLILESAGCFRGGGPPLLGLTATPERTDKLRLDDVFQGICYHYQLRTAVEAGYLCDVEMVQRPLAVNLDGVSVSGGDFAPGELDEALLEAGIVGDVCKAVDELARDRKTIVFTVSVKQAKLIAKGLCEQGHRATHVDATTPPHERAKRLNGLSTGEFTHIVNVGVLTEGFDEPTIDCIVMARPTTSKSLYVQCSGRGLRIAPGKDKCLLIDMVGVSARHALVQAPVIFGLEDHSGGETRESSDEPLPSVRKPLLLTQLKGVAPLQRSKLRWLRARDDLYTLNCGDGGSVLMRSVDDGWMIEVVGRRGSVGKEMLTMTPVDMELAQGIAEDYVRRAASIYVASKTARWRGEAATDKQVAGLRRWGIDAAGITKGEASDLMTAKEAASPRHDPATAKQMRALRYYRARFDEATLTKGEATKMITNFKRR